MQRQLKFRAWAQVERGHKRIIEWETSRRLIAEWIGNKERGVEIMAWTGLKDKNGKEIYEGDFLLLSKRFKPVIWDERRARFAWGDDHTRDLHISSCIKMEIIGNIYENRDLLV